MIKDIVMTREAAEVGAEEGVLGEYVAACKRRLWLIVLIAAAFGAIAAAWSMRQAPVYQSKATVVIESQEPVLLDTGKTGRNPDTSPEYFQTHFELMKSRYVLERSAQRLKLSERAEYQAPPSSTSQIFKKWQKKDTRDSALVAKAEEERLIAQLGDNIDILPVRGTRVAYITASSIDPNFAALAANTVAAVYMERNQQLAAESRSQAAQWFTTHLDELRQKVQKAQQDLYVYRAKHGSLTGAERKTVASHALTELNTQSVKAEMAKAEARSRLEQIQAAVGSKGGKSKAIDWSKLDSQSQVLGSHLIQTLRAQEITMSAQVAELSEKYGSLHPKLTRAKAELTSLRERIGQELQKIYGSVRHDYDAAVVQDRAIKDAIKRYNADKIKLERDEVEYGMLEREVESSQHLYDIFLKTTKEADVSAGMHANNVYLADSASVTTVPARPRTKLNILLAVLSGLMSGTWLAIALEGRGKTLRAPADVERYIPDVSLLGIVPMIPKSSVPQKSLVQPNAMTPVAENIRIIRAHLLQMKPESLPSRVLITSPGENEGKTTLAVNLAIAMAQLQRTRVVLVNVDFRGKQSHPVYDVGKWDSSPRGLAQFLQGDATLSEVVHQSIFPNLMVVPQGGCPHNPTELLYSDQMSQLLDWALDKNCHLILDGPPVLPVADAAVLASKVDGVLMVVSAGETTREACRQAIQRVTLSGGTVLGVVMQKARPHDVRYVGEMVQAHA